MNLVRHVNGKTILSVASPVTQTAEAVAQLIKSRSRGQSPAEMPAFYRLGARLVLVRSKKGDAYYVTTPGTCSCPAATYRPGEPCKHRAEHFPSGQSKAAAYQAKQRELRAQALAGKGGSGKLELAGDDIGDFRPVFRPSEAVV
ncbi:MAG: hypothetical protein A4E45_01770 [Methanosaeta sp. PtaB.Bin039]|nr:MAG: hypothetical protein A4E45_01770 [Methanosaeta sp. PtaB.Bin039]